MNSIQLKDQLRSSLPETDLVDVSDAVEELRWVKSEQEIGLIRRACVISDQGMKVALEAVKPGKTELEIAALAEQYMINMGSDVVKHRTIVASGSRAILFHPFATQKKIADGDLVSVDLGAVYQGYCSDVARTCVAGRPSEEEKNDFDVFLRAQESVLRTLKAGVSMKEIESAAQQVMETAGCKLLGDSVGHSVGLCVEEKPRLSTKRTPYPDAKIEKDMVVTVFQSSIQSKRFLGLRLEDTVLITDSGVERLSTYPRELFS